jgi:hypothetical protein
VLRFERAVRTTECTEKQLDEKQNGPLIYMEMEVEEKE